MKIISAIVISTLTILMYSCTKDLDDNNSNKQALRLLSEQEAVNCEVFIYSRTSEKRGLRPVNFDHIDEVPRVLQHRLVPITEEWETEVCFTADGQRSLRRKRIGEGEDGNSYALGYRPSTVDEISISKDGTVTSYSKGSITKTDLYGPRSDTSVYNSLKDYRRLPKDSFVLAMTHLRDSLAAYPEKYSDLSIKIHADYVGVGCNSGQFVGMQLIDAELQIPRVSVVKGDGPGEYIKTMTAARLDNGNEFPTIEKIDTKWVLSLDKTSDVPMYFFENKEFKEFTITRN